MKNDFFAEKAADYDTLKSRTDNVDAIALGIIKSNVFEKHMHIMEFGSGTGLLLSNVAPHVAKITAVDISPSMNSMLISKKNLLECKLEILEIDITKQAITEKFDGIISSMTIHHIEDVAALFRTFYNLLNTNGFIAIADLDTEDGSFHTTDTGVHHFGFNRDEFIAKAKAAGFNNLTIDTVSLIEKPTGNYSVFLLTGRK
jgi:cyclopropane fatty-acyl-phospholipid synthase-like methyltransferase